MWYGTDFVWVFQCFLQCFQYLLIVIEHSIFDVTEFRDQMCLNTKKIFPNSIEHVVFKIFIPKVKPITVILYRPPNSNNFLNLLSNSFQQIDLNKKKLSFGHFNIKLVQNRKLLLKENQSNQIRDLTSPFTCKYEEFC